MLSRLNLACGHSKPNMRCESCLRPIAERAADKSVDQQAEVVEKFVGRTTKESGVSEKATDAATIAKLTTLTRSN